MLSYLSTPKWLEGEPEPNPKPFSGTCHICETRHYNGAGEGFETQFCQCGSDRCCSSCNECRECNSKVCRQCCVDVSSRTEPAYLCSDCHRDWLDSMDRPQLRECVAVPVMVSALVAGMEF